MRILLASDYYPPFIGGAHRQTQLLAHELHKRGHSVSVATVWQLGLPEEHDEDGVHVYRLRQLLTIVPRLARVPRQLQHPPFPDPVTTWKLRSLVERLKPDLIHSFGWYTYSVALALIGKDIPLLIAARDYGYVCANRTLLRDNQTCSGPKLLKCLQCSGKYYGAPKGWLATLGVFAGLPLIRAKMRGLHSISTYVQEILERDFLVMHPAAKNHLVRRVIPSFREDGETADGPSGLDLEPYLRQLPAEPFILFVGALRREKGIVPLLAAYEQLDTRVPLVLIGTIERDTPSTFPHGVKVLQAFPHQAVMAAWERSLFGVIPSLWPEPLGSVVYEGMSQGKAVIGTRPGGHADMIVHGKTGLLVPSGDVDALAEAMRLLITNADLRDRLGRAAREQSAHYRADVVVPQFEQLFYTLQQQKSQGAADAPVASLGQR